MSGLQKNVASQKWRVFAFDADGAPVTGDAANITAKIAKDYGAATAITDTNPTETEDGYYVFDLAQAETNADVLNSYPESSTSGVQVIGDPGTIFTVPAAFADNPMRGTDSAATATNLATVDTVVDGIQTDLSNATDGLGALKTLIDTVDTNVDSILVDTGTDGVVVATASKTGYSLSATGLDLITQSATGVIEFAKAIWDRVLTSGTHNIANSAGKRVRDLKEQPGYEGGFIYYDSVGGSAGSDPYTNGILDEPVNNMADLNSLITALGFGHVHVANGSTVTLAANQENQNFIGDGWTLVLAGYSISNSTIEGASNVSGICTGTIPPKFVDCELYNVTIPGNSKLFACGFNSDITLGSIGVLKAIGCYSGVAGILTPSLDTGAGIGNNDVNLRWYSGGIDLKNLGQVGTDNVSIEGDGQVKWNANCIGGTTAVRGHYGTTGKAAYITAGGTVSDDSNFDSSEILDDWEDGGRLDLILDAVEAKTTNLPADPASETNVNANETKIDALQTTADGIPTTAEFEARTFTTAQVAAIVANAETTPPVTFTGGTTTTAVLGNVDGSAASSVNATYKGRILVFNAGTLDEQATDITAYDGATKTATITTVTTAVTSGHTAIMC